MTARLESLRIALVAAVFCSSLGFPARATAQEPSPGEQGPSGTTVDFVIGVGDVLSISVWKEEGLQVSIPVRPDGKVSVPLLGEIGVAGRAPLDVQAELTMGYENFVTAPAVSLVVTEINSRRIYVLGEVAEAGVYDIVQPTNLLQALAMAGGFTDFAKKDEVVILRRDSSRERRLVVSVKAITSGKKLEDNVQLLPGDTIFVP